MAITTITLQHKLASLKSDLEAWQEIAGNTRDYPAFAKHQSQILRLYDLFSSLIDTLASEIDAMAGDDLDLAADLSDKILQGHALWSYFRSKLFLRYSPNLQRYLAAADEFAWGCYKPLMSARQAAGDGSTSTVPPLLYLGRDLSPLVYPRDWSLANQIPDVDDVVFDSLVRHAPVSVVSLPFYQTTHLPETMVLAHEMGHVVEIDLELSEALDQALAGSALSEDHKQTWQRCRVEAFADVFGATAGGIAFCHALAGFLAKSPAKIKAESIGSSSKYAYPTSYLRVLLVLEVLRSRENGSIPEAAMAIEEQWRTSYGRDHHYQEYEKDLTSIVRCFIDTPFDELSERSIRDLVGLTAKNDTEAKKCADKMLGYRRIPQIGEPRALFAAATMAFYRDPQGYEKQRVEDLVLDRIEAVADMAPRKREHLSVDSKEQDRKAGATLARQLIGFNHRTRTSPSRTT